MKFTEGERAFLTTVILIGAIGIVTCVVATIHIYLLLK